MFAIQSRAQFYSLHNWSDFLKRWAFTHKCLCIRLKLFNSSNNPTPQNATQLNPMQISLTNTNKNITFCRFSKSIKMRLFFKLRTKLYQNKLCKLFFCEIGMYTSTCTENKLSCSLIKKTAFWFDSRSVYCPKMRMLCSDHSTNCYKNVCISIFVRKKGKYLPIVRVKHSYRILSIK